MSQRLPIGGIGQTIIGDTAAREQLSETFLELADQADARKEAIDELVAPVSTAAALLLGDGDRRTAATLFDWIERQYRKASIAYVADYYARRAKDCRARRRTGK